MASATIVGGNSVNLSLSAREAVIAKDALAALSSQFSSSTVMASPLTPPPSSPDSLDVYDIDSRYYDEVSVPEDAEAVVITGNNGVEIDGNGNAQLLVGGRGNDTINVGGGDATVLGGMGDDLIRLNNPGKPGGDVHISMAAGNDTVKMWGGNATVVDARGGDRIEIIAGNNTVNASGNTVQGPDFFIKGGENLINTTGGDFTVAGGNSDVTVAGRSASVLKTGGTLDITLEGSNNGHYSLTGDMTIHQTATGNYHMALDGNDTVYLGAGNDTITQLQSATVYGGSGKLNYTGGTGADSVVAGSGRSTILGGGGFDTIIGGSGMMKADGGDGGDLLIGGSYRDTLTGGAGGDIFRFASTASGGTHIVTDFVQGEDKIDLSGGGYSLADISQTSVKAGSTVIKLQDGTQIVLKNFTNLSGSDIV